MTIFGKCIINIIANGRMDFKTEIYNKSSWYDVKIIMDKRNSHYQYTMATDETVVGRIRNYY